MTDGIVGARVVLRQRFVYMSCRDGGVAGGNRDLVEIRYNVSRSIDPVDRRALMGIYLRHPTSFVFAPKPTASSDRTPQPRAG
jgi:hypothetical protein